MYSSMKGVDKLKLSTISIKRFGCHFLLQCMWKFFNSTRTPKKVLWSTFAFTPHLLLPPVCHFLPCSISSASVSPPIAISCSHLPLLSCAAISCSYFSLPYYTLNSSSFLSLCHLSQPSPLSNWAALFCWYILQPSPPAVLCCHLLLTYCAANSHSHPPYYLMLPSVDNLPLLSHIVISPVLYFNCHPFYHHLLVTSCTTVLHHCLKLPFLMTSPSAVSWGCLLLPSLMS